MIKSLNHYRMMDLTLLTILAVVSEIMADVLHKRLPGAGFYLSFSLLITVIAIIRWGKIGGLVYVIAGIPMILLGPNSLVQDFMLNFVGNASILIFALMIERFDKIEIVRDNLKLLIFTAMAFAVVALGKGLMLFLYGDSFFDTSVVYFLSNLFSMIMTYIVLLIVRRKGDMLVDMETYIIDSQTEELQ